MPNKWQVSAIVVIAVSAAIAAIYFEQPTKALDFLRVISASITATTTSILVFHLGLWRYLPKAIAPQPDINGTWRVQIRPWSLEDNTKLLEPFDGFMFVKQNYFTLSMRQETEDVSSELEVEKFVLTRGGQFVLWAIYFAGPRPSTPPGLLRPHYGAFELTYSQHELKGHFWTDGVYVGRTGRKIIGGHLRLYDRNSVLFDDYEAAAAAYAINPGGASPPGPQLPA
jgi:hypothetical protein